MNVLDSMRVIVVAPHFQTFIREQVAYIRESVAHVTAMIPIPHFSEIAMRMPVIGRRFRFMAWALESNTLLADTFVSPRYFTLPIESLRKRNHTYVADACLKSVRNLDTCPNLIHTHFLDFGYAGAAIKDELDIPLILTTHGGDVYQRPMQNEWYNKMARNILASADQVISVSEFNARILKNLGVPAGKLHIIPNGYNHQVFRPMNQSDMRSKLELPLEKRIILSVGRLSPEKGHVILLDAFARLTRTDEHIMLVIVGSGSEREALTRRTKDLGIEHKLLLPGLIPNHEIPYWMNACDLVVLPSLKESFPTVIPEAMACGKPMVGTRVGGVPEVIVEGKSGLLVPPGNIEALKDAISAALEYSWSPDQIVASSNRYRWDRLVPRILDLYVRETKS